MWKVLFIMSNLENHDHVKLDFQKGGPGSKWLIHGTKHPKDNQLQNLKRSCRIS